MEDLMRPRPAIARYLIPSALLVFASQANAASVSISVPSPAVGTVQVTAQASAGLQIVNIQIQVDKIDLGSCLQSPCSAAWDTTKVADGRHTVRVKVYRRGSLPLTARASVTVDNAPATTASSTTSP